MRRAILEALAEPVVDDDLEPAAARVPPRQLEAQGGTGGSRRVGLARTSYP